MVRRQKRSGAVHAGLHFVENKERSVVPAQRLRGGKVVGIRNPYAALGLHGLDEECGVAPGGELLFQSFEVPERHRVGLGKERAKSTAPVLAIHERQRATGQTMKSTVRVEQTRAPGVGARELDGGFDAFAPRAGEKYLCQPPSGALTKAFRQFARQFGDMALQHDRTALFQFISDGCQHIGMIVPHIVHAVSGEKIEDAAPFPRE